MIYTIFTEYFHICFSLPFNRNCSENWVTHENALSTVELYINVCYRVIYYIIWSLVNWSKPMSPQINRFYRQRWLFIESVSGFELFLGPCTSGRWSKVTWDLQVKAQQYHKVMKLSCCIRSILYFLGSCDTLHSLLIFLPLPSVVPLFHFLWMLKSLFSMYTFIQFSWFQHTLLVFLPHLSSSSENLRPSSMSHQIQNQGYLHFNGRSLSKCSIYVS